MEENKNKIMEKKNGFSSLKLYIKNSDVKCISTLISPNITELYISNNKLKHVPDIILNLENIKVLDLSFNDIQYFDNKPNFSETIEYLNLSNNNLLGPPYWVWASNNKLVEINLSSNHNISKAFQNGYFEELLNFNCLVKHVIIYNCNLKNYTQLLRTFPNTRKLEFGTSNVTRQIHTNKTDDVVWKILENIYDIEIINLSNTSVWHIDPCIGKYKNLTEIDLSYNEVSKLPDEFCDILTLEVCILSHNYIMYLPEKLFKLEKLITLAVDNNELCMLPECISKLPCLAKLDLYNNFLHEIPEGIEKFEEIDFAMNYFEEPSDKDYERKKEKCRSNHNDRNNGRKKINELPDSGHSTNLTDEEFGSYDSKNKDYENRSMSSPEDWDSDEHWVPHLQRTNESSQSPWIVFIKKKINEGNFCPIDNHIVPITEQVKYAKLCNPTIEYESDGQFDDLSDDNS